MKKKFYPDFLIIPFQLITDKKLQPLDRNIYGVIYWLEKLSVGKCIASNNFMADILGSSSVSIQNSLLRLEKRGHIKRFFKDKERKIRSEIKCLISFQASSFDDRVSSDDDSEVSSFDDHISNTSFINKNNKDKADKSAGQEVQSLIALFEPLNPNYKRLFSNRTQRACLKRMIAEHGAEKVEESIKYAISISGQKFSPVITTPYQLENKLGQLVVFAKQNKKEAKVSIV